jgi:hypothetical protein
MGAVWWSTSVRSSPRCLFKCGMPWCSRSSQYSVWHRSSLCVRACFEGQRHRQDACVTLQGRWAFFVKACSMYRLVFLTGPHQGRRLAVQKGDLVIGHDADCHVQLHDPAVASRHAILEQRPDGFFIKAIRSRGRAQRERGGDAGRTAETRGRNRYRGGATPIPVVARRRRPAETAIRQVPRSDLCGCDGDTSPADHDSGGTLFIFWRMDPIHVPVVEDTPAPG